MGVAIHVYEEGGGGGTVRGDLSACIIIGLYSSQSTALAVNLIPSACVYIILCCIGTLLMRKTVTKECVYILKCSPLT